MIFFSKLLYAYCTYIPFLEYIIAPSLWFRKPFKLKNDGSEPSIC
jgi:hypothetical protein